MTMTKTPMMTPMIPRFTSPPSIRVLTPPLQIRSFNTSLWLALRSEPGPVQPNLAKIGDQRGSSADNPGKRYEDWELDDPAGQDIDHVRAIRDEINRRVEQLIGQMQPIS
jgi:protein-tyrosine-phosphatase